MIEYSKSLSMSYNLTDLQKALLCEIISLVRAHKLDEEFMVVWYSGGASVLGADNTDIELTNEITEGKLNALYVAGLLHLDIREHNTNITLTNSAYTAVDTDFDAPDTSFLRQLNPLADVTNLDTALKKRVLPILGAGASDPVLWDSAVRTATVILEERLRDVGTIADQMTVGRDLVNRVFGKTGTLTGKFTVDSERESYRDLYAGVVGLVRNPSAHRLIDPMPEEGGVLIVLVNLLLTKLEALR
jgi:hypothetical protein